MTLLPHLANFELAWRWKNVPPETQHQIRPLNRTESLLADIRSRELFSHMGPGSDTMRLIATRSVKGEAPIVVGAWLRSQLPDDEIVTVSWGSETPVAVPWLLFTDFWADFCYPGSDDAIVWPTGEAWAVCYRHSEQFEIARRAA
jgi:hypothetical protein